MSVIFLEVGFFLQQILNECVAATCAYTRAIDGSLRAGYRSILVLTSLANTRADQSERRLNLRQLGRLSGNNA